MIVDTNTLSAPGEFSLFVGQDVKRQVSQEIESGVRESVVRVRYAEADLAYDQIVPMNRRPRVAMETITPMAQPLRAAARLSNLFPSR